MKLRYLFILVVLASCVNRNGENQGFHASKLSSLYISLSPNQLDSILNDRDNRVPAQALFITAENDTLYDGSLTHIKTRGNTTFWYEKKPFNIKFPQKKQFLGLDKSRSFVLLANTLDDSYIRNAIAFDLAHAIGLPATKYTYLSLYINGEYKGLYQMTNKVEVSKHGLHITDLDELNKQANPHPLKEYGRFQEGNDCQIIQRKGVLLQQNPEDITGGYLLDNSGQDFIYRRSISGFVSDAGDPIRIRSPQHASPLEVDYIATAYNDMEAAIHAADGIHPLTGKHYSEYIDMESFALYYLLNELLLNQDGGFVSFFMYKDSDSVDSKIYAGPIWDFDKSLSSRGSEPEVLLPNEIYVSEQVADFSTEPYSGGLLFHLWQHKDFQGIVKNVYYKVVSPCCHEYLNKETIDSLVKVLESEAIRDERLYHANTFTNYRIATRNAVDFLRKRLEFLDWYFSTSPADVICVDYQSKTQMKPHERKIKIYYPVGKPIHVPSSLRPYTGNSQALVPALYFAGTDSLVSDGAVFHSPKVLELRGREPTWGEVQIRRIRKGLKKWSFLVADNIYS